MKIPPRILGLIVVGLGVPAAAGCGKQRFVRTEKDAPTVAQPSGPEADAGPPRPDPDPCRACGMG